MTRLLDTSINLELNASANLEWAMSFPKNHRANILHDLVKEHDVEHPTSHTGCCYADVYGRYPQGVLVSDNDSETSSLVTHTIASSLSPFAPIRPLADDVSVFNSAVRGIVEAVRDRILTEDEGNAIITMISRALATRRVDAAFMQLSTLNNPTFASFGIK
jgi:hypothetical protein